MCRSGCPTQDHGSWGECARAANFKVAYCQSASGKDYTAQKKWDAELDLYKATKASGLEPGSTKASKIRKAIETYEKRPSQA